MFQKLFLCLSAYICALFISFNAYCSDTFSVYHEVLDMFYVSKNKDEAMALLDKRISENKNSVDLKKLKLSLLIVTKKYDAAKKEIEEILQISPYNTEFLLSRCTLQEALAYMQNKNYDQKTYIPCYRQAVETMRSHIQATKLEKNNHYVLAALMAELPGADDIRQAYLRYLGEADPDDIAGKKHRDFYRNFERQNGVPKLSQ